MEARINLSAISEKMCIDLVREIIDNNVSAIVHFKGKDKEDKDFVKVLDVQNSKQVTSLVPVLFEYLEKIELDAHPSKDNSTKKVTSKSATSSESPKSNMEKKVESADDGKKDPLKYFKKDIKRIKTEVENPEDYPSAFVKSILGMDSDCKKFAKYIEIIQTLTEFKDDEVIKSQKIIEKLGRQRYDAFYNYLTRHYGSLNISVKDRFIKTVELYLSLYKE